MLVYKIVGADEWRAAVAAGVYEGSADDLRDGFIHLSTASQVEGTLARHFAGRDDLLLVAFDADSLGGGELKFEVSRGGESFPHFYATLQPILASWTMPLRLDDEGRHVVPGLET